MIRRQRARRRYVLLPQQLGGEFLLSAATPSAVKSLNPHEGRSMFALLKSVALAG